MFLLGITSLSEIAKQCPSLTDEEFKKYEELSPRPVINTKNFRIDFKQPWLRCEFNLEASAFFVQNFLECVSGGMYRMPPIPSRFFTDFHVKSALDSHMPHARTLWKNGQNPPSPTKAAQRAANKRIDTRKGTVRCH